jgi:hypothetical protein
MANSDSIKTQIADNTEFTKYLEACTANLLESAAKDRQSFKNNIQTHYKEGWTQNVLGSGLHKDYKQSDEFSLDKISATVKSIVNGFFGANMPAGSDKTPDATKILQTMASEEVLILQAALTVVTNLLAIFSEKTELTYTSTEAHEMVAAGLTLHLFVMDTSYTSSTYFRGKSIEEDIFEYQLIWSPEQEKEIGKKKVMDGYIKNLDAAILSLGKVQANFDKEAEKDDPDQPKLKRLADTIELMNNTINKFRTMLNGVTLRNVMLLKTGKH